MSDEPGRLIALMFAASALSASACGLAVSYGRPPPPFEEKYATQLDAFDHGLFPTEDYEMRNAASRKDGYWPYVSRKEKPPTALVYGEFPLPFFHRVLERACIHGGYRDGNQRSEATFADLGSGTGRLVLWAAATDQWKRCVGVELLCSLHEEAVAKLAEAQSDSCALSPLPTADVALYQGSWEDDSLLAWSELDVCFAYTTAFDHGPDGRLHAFSEALAPTLRRGCIVCTTDYQLSAASGFELLEQLDGPNEGVGGTSVAYIHRKVVGGRSEALRQQERADKLAARCEALEATLSERVSEISSLEARCRELEAERDALADAKEALEAELKAAGGELLGDDAWAGYAASLAEGGGGDAEAFTAALRADLLGEDGEGDEQDAGGTAAAPSSVEQQADDDDEGRGQEGKKKSRSWWPWS